MDLSQRFQVSMLIQQVQLGAESNGWAAFESTRVNFKLAMGNPQPQTANDSPAARCKQEGVSYLFP